jgi:cell division septation protein DedD
MSSEELKKAGGLRKRILGALILFALAVIFLPMFFEYVPNNVYLPKIVKAPEEPSVVALSPDDFASPKISAVAGAKPAAWSVQVSGLKLPADKVVKELKQAGYPAYLDQGKVLIGPETNQKILDRWVDELQKKQGETSLVPYEPGK